MSIEINPKESTILSFEVNVTGSKETPVPRLVIPISDNGMSLVFEGTMKDGKVSVDVSELLTLTDSLEFNGKLEVVVEDSIFVPWEEKLVIIQPLEVQAEAVKIEVTEKKKVGVSAGITKSSEEGVVTITEKKVDHAKIDVKEFRKKTAKEQFDEKL
jgi:hypothetical protein